MGLSNGVPYMSTGVPYSPCITYVALHWNGWSSVLQQLGGRTSGECESHLGPLGGERPTVLRVPGLI